MGCTPGKPELQSLACQGVLSPRLVFAQGRLEPHILCASPLLCLRSIGLTETTHIHMHTGLHTLTRAWASSFWSLSKLLQLHTLNSNRTSYCDGQFAGLTHPLGYERIEGKGFLFLKAQAPSTGLCKQRV